LNKIIEVTIGPKGETKIETKGFAGTDCRLASQFVEEALGQRSAERLTAEFYRGQQTNQDLRQSN
jgi:DUF2997 family protein